MKVLIQRVSSASVNVEGKTIGKIGCGILALLGVEPQDTEEVVERMVQKILAYRVFPDDDGRMNRSLLDIDGGLLVVSQFTLAANTKKGTKPSFSSAAEPGHANAIYEQFIEHARSRLTTVETGSFGADMQVSLINDGPVTFQFEL